MTEVEAAPHRQLLHALVLSALRAEYGVRMRQAQRKPTDYYAGRRAGFVAAAAMLIDRLYGGEEEAAKEQLKKCLRIAGEAFDAKDLIEPEVAGPLGWSIVEETLKVI